MNDADIELYLYRILCGYLIFSYDNERYELRYASNALKYEASILYDNILNDEKYNEWIREEYLIRIIINLGLWENNTEKVIAQLEKTIDNLKVEIFKNYMNKDMVNNIRPKIRSMESQLGRVLKIKNDFHSNTLEGYASSIKNEYLICNTLYKNNKLVFKDTANNNSKSYQYFNNLIHAINEHAIGMTDFRNIARSNSWRSYWNANKDNVFSSQVADWTDEQKSLVNISKMYDSVYAHPECPDQTVINDDDFLDGWMIHQKRKIEKQKTEQSIDMANPRLRNAQEVFVIANNEEDAENVFGLNSGESMHRMKEKLAMIRESKEVDDLDLPDVKREALNQMNSMLKQRKS
jgi:hypothetical protein